MKQFLYSIFFVLLFCGLCLAQNSPLRILEQPRPELPKDYGTNDFQGSIVLRVEFLADGAIGKISPVSTLPSLTDLAVEAAKKIKFQPALKEGKPVSVVKEVSYIYGAQVGGWKIPTQNLEQTIENDEKAEAVLKKAVQVLGGDNYLKVKSQIGRGKFSNIRDGVISSFQTFTDIIVFPNKERTEFKAFGTKNMQTNTGETGWIYDGEAQVINVQNEDQIKDFKRAMSVSLDNLLREQWRGKAVLIYAGKREASLGKRNDVVKLTFEDGLMVEFEFTAEGV